MNTTIQKIITSTSIAAVLLALPASVFSATQSGQRKEAITEAKCAIVNNRIDARVNHFENRKVAHVRAYRNAKERADKIADKYDQDGYDTTQLRADAKVFDDKITTAAKTYESFIVKLTEAKQYNCGDSNGKFRSTMEEARALLKTFRTQITDARNYFKTVVKVDIKAVKDQKKS